MYIVNFKISPQSVLSIIDDCSQDNDKAKTLLYSVLDYHHLLSYMTSVSTIINLKTNE